MWDWMCSILAFSWLSSYYTDKTTKDIFDDLKAKNKTTARVNFKINNYNLLGEKVSKEYKAMKAKRLLVKIEEKMNVFASKQNDNKDLSSTTIPFFDIDFSTILDIINKNNQEKIPRNKELQIFHKNLRLFERLFGFNFNNKESLLAINNQSLVTLDNTYPEIREFYDEADVVNLLSSPLKTKESHSLDNTIETNKDFKLLAQKSEILSEEKAHNVT